MAKTQRKFLHKRPKGANKKSQPEQSSGVFFKPRNDVSITAAELRGIKPISSNERNFYRSLFAIVLLIVATAALLNHAGLSSENSGSNGLVGMAVEAAELR